MLSYRLLRLVASSLEVRWPFRAGSHPQRTLRDERLHRRWSKRETVAKRKVEAITGHVLQLVSVSRQLKHSRRARRAFVAAEVGDVTTKQEVRRILFKMIRSLSSGVQDDRLLIAPT
ncbi:hypothetical protein P389DRAFT_16655 [Cystobasidium minutum MCA 4210]|uniref:uncharacterized protein n=1 Tax=Cystobasidium minutum MCA 4210 TaxID=1397322 RepID=UPI0034CF3134|eukprot:jgi/Rhomi1/16655/CE16654_387